MYRQQEMKFVYRVPVIPTRFRYVRVNRSNVLKRKFNEKVSFNLFINSNHELKKDPLLNFICDLRSHTLFWLHSFFCNTKFLQSDPIIKIFQKVKAAKRIKDHVKMIIRIAYVVLYYFNVLET